MAKAYSPADGVAVLRSLVAVVQENKDYLSDIDGQIGDGDHGINMNKGFTLFAEALEADEYDLSAGFMALSKVLMSKIGGSMGPLYGMFFRAMGKA
ncbi:MAG: DAK2 domain-containing protein, partial [Planctomycetota bacterium]